VKRSLLAALCALFLLAAIPGLGLAASTIQTPAAVTLKAGTPVYLKLSKPLSSEFNEMGDPVHLTVAQAVTVDGYVAIAENAQAVGIVSQAEPRAAEGKAGVIQFKLVSVAAANGKSVHLSSSTSSAKGEDSETATRAFGLGICPFVLFNKGWARSSRATWPRTSPWPRPDCPRRSRRRISSAHEMGGRSRQRGRPPAFLAGRRAQVINSVRRV